MSSKRLDPGKQTYKQRDTDSKTFDHRHNKVPSSRLKNSSIRLSQESARKTGRNQSSVTNKYASNIVAIGETEVADAEANGGKLKTVDDENGVKNSSSS